LVGGFQHFGGICCYASTEIEAADYLDIFVPTNQTTRRHIPEDSNIKYNCQQKCVILYSDAKNCSVLSVLIIEVMGKMGRLLGVRQLVSPDDGTLRSAAGPVLQSAIQTSK